MHRMMIRILSGFILGVALSSAAFAIDEMKGVMRVVPVPAGKTVKIDGDLADWDLSAKEWMIMDEMAAHRYAADVAVMYDDGFLYIGMDALVGATALSNPEPPDGKIWCGHSIEFRCIASPDAPYPFVTNGYSRDMTSPLAKFFPLSNTIRMYRDTDKKVNHIIIQPGPPYGPAQVVDPAGSEIAIRESADKTHYILEAKVPWTAIGVEDGKCPFKPGQGAAGFITITWPGNYRIESLYADNTAGQGYVRISCWGRLEFTGQNNLPPRHGTLVDYLARAELQDGNPIELNLPAPAKVSVNIIGKDGSILREVIGGQPRPAGKSTVYWDGFDWRGNPLPKGDYTWKAYASPGLTPKFLGCVGTGGSPGYQTPDGTGGWGGEYGGPIDVACDDSGVYLIWLSYESGKGLVKLAHDGHTLWRSGPLADGFRSCATNGKYLYTAYASGYNNQQRLLRMDATTGAEVPFPGVGRVDLGEAVLGDNGTDSDQYAPELSGLAASPTEVFLSLYRQNKILVLDAETGAVKRQLTLKHPRGLVIQKDGTLLAISCDFDTLGNRIYSFANGAGAANFYLQLFHVRSAYHLAFDEKGRLLVTDCGSTDQVWVYTRDAHGNWVNTDWIGKTGGRPWGGAYDSGAFLRPTGICADGRGGLYVTDVEIPRVVKKYRTADFSLEQEWFGDLAYGPGGCSAPDDPLEVYAEYQSGRGTAFVRGRLKGDGSNAIIDAYWDLSKLGLPWPFGRADTGVPLIFKGKNGVTYLCGTFPNGDAGYLLFYKIDGDCISPIAYVGGWQDLYLRTSAPPFPDKPRFLEFWSDLNHNGQIDDDEKQLFPRLAGESLLAKSLGDRFAGLGPSFLSPRGDLYLVIQNNKAIMVPAAKMDAFGAIRWNPAAARVVARDIYPGADYIPSEPRGGILGVRPDAAGNTYYVYNVYKNPKASPYASAAWTEAMGEGLGHCGEFQAVRIAKYAPDGTRLWEVGRKATKMARPGETYHFWEMAGLIGKGYVAGATEHTPVVVYSPDGFFVDTILDDPTRGEPFSAFNIGGGETFNGRTVWYPERGECYLFTGNSHTYCYRVDGFAKDGTVAGERRFGGTVTLTKHVDPHPTVRIEPAPYELARVTENPITTTRWPGAWEQMIGNDGSALARVQVVQDGTNLFARFEVVDATPLENKAPDLYQLFKGGDAVGLYLGKAGKRDQPEAGDIRLLAALVDGKATVVAMAPTGGTRQKPYEYFTPASGKKPFAFVGVLDGAEAKFDRTPMGYTAQLRVPLEALAGLTFAPGDKLAFEAEVLCSGAGTRGLQTISRNHLYTSKGFSPAKMTDDIPTEAWLYPAQWGTALVK